jgi:hypothetical protein
LYVIAILALLLVLIVLLSARGGKRGRVPGRYHLFWTRGDLSFLPKRWRRARNDDQRGT